METVINGLSDAVKSFDSFIGDLSQSSLTLSKTKKWGPKEVLIHIVFWHEQYVKILNALLKYEKPKLLTGSFMEWNARSVEENKNKDVGSLLERLRKAERELESLAKKPGAEKIKLTFKEGGMVRTLPDALTKIEAHIRSHQRQLS